MIALKIYKILSYILLPFAALFSLFALLALLVALANPIMFLPLFLLICVVLYVFSSFQFYQKAIVHTKSCKPFLRDFINVNAIVSIFFAASAIIQFIQIKTNPSIIQKTFQQAIEIQQPKAPADVLPMMEMVMNTTLYIMLFFAIVLLTHIVFTFRFMKLFKHTFNAH